MKFGRVDHRTNTKMPGSKYKNDICMSKHVYTCVTVYGKTGHNAACVNIEKRSIDFLKMYCFKPTEGNG